MASARLLLGAVLEVGHTRLQLASTELEEERLRLAELLLLATMALFFIGIGIVLASMLVVLLLWDGPREVVLGILTAAFLVVGGVAALAWRRKARSKPPLLSATLQELRNDQAALQRGSADPNAP